MISKTKAIAALEELKGDSTGVIAATIEDCQKVIGEMMEDDGWIPVTERLPENDVMVIGYTPCDGFMFAGYYHEEPKYDWKVWRIVTAMRSTKVMTKKVTHWMPLPEPPKEPAYGK